MADLYDSAIDSMKLSAKRKAAQAKTTTARRSKPSSVYDMDAWRKAIDLTAKIEKEQATIAEKRFASALKNGLQAQKDNNDFIAKMYESRGKDIRNSTTNMTRVLNQREKSFAGLKGKVEDAEGKILAEVDSIYFDSNRSNRVVDVMNVLHPTEVAGETKKPGLASDDPRFMATMRGIMKRVNDHDGSELFLVDPSTGELNVDASLANLNKLDPSSGEGSKVAFYLRDYDRVWGEHQAKELVLREGVSRVKGKLAKAKAAEQEGRSAEAQKLLDEAQADAENLAPAFSAASSVATGDKLVALQSRADKKESVLARAVEHEGVARQRALAGGTPISQAESVRREYADWVGSNVFQAWASDYGFDRVGSIERGEDGELDYSTFKPGHGLKRAIKAYQRQEGRKPGGYGLRKTQTGEVLQVELKDGSTVTGHRLRRHLSEAPRRSTVLVG